MRPEVIAGQPIWLAGVLMTGLAILGAAVVELVVRHVIPPRVRLEHNQVASAVFTVIGTTYAVLLAFVAMLAFDGFNKAQAVTDAEASLVQNVYQLVDGLNGPEMPSMRNDIVAYARSVATIEWPVQAAGGPVGEEQPSLNRLTQTALHLRPGNIADGNLHALLLEDLTRLANARRERLLAERTPIPDIVWFVLLAGGGITIGFGSFLGAPNPLMHLAMSALLAASGTLVLLLIVALSNPFRGEFRVSAEPFERVLTQMGSGHAAP